MAAEHDKLPEGAVVTELALREAAFPMIGLFDGEPPLVCPEVARLKRLIQGVAGDDLFDNETLQRGVGGLGERFAQQLDTAENGFADGGFAESSLNDLTTIVRVNVAEEFGKVGMGVQEFLQLAQVVRLGVGCCGAGDEIP